MVTARKALAALAIGGVFLSAGCSDGTGPGSGQSASALQSTASVVSQDLAQLSAAGVTSEATAGVFSIGWKKFVGPNITDVGTIGEAFAVVHTDSSATTIRPTGIDIGTVRLAYSGGEVELVKRTGKNGGVTYTTFTKGPPETTTTPVNIPFIAGGVYTFAVSGGIGFSAASFKVTAPPSLLTITNHADRDTVLRTKDLTVAWSGGSASDSVLVRIVPHLRREQLEAREEEMGPGGHHGHGGMGGSGGGEFHPEDGGPRPERDGCFMTGGPLEGMGPEFARGVVMLVPNTGSFTLPAADLATLLGGTEAAELMVGVTQVVAQSAVHSGKAVRVLLRNGDRIVLLVQ
jgi:hypothetical protein